MKAKLMFLEVIMVMCWVLLAISGFLFATEPWGVRSSWYLIHFIVAWFAEFWAANEAGKAKAQ